MRCMMERAMGRSCCRGGGCQISGASDTARGPSWAMGRGTDCWRRGMGGSSWGSGRSSLIFSSLRLPEQRLQHRLQHGPHAQNKHWQAQIQPMNRMAKNSRPVWTRYSREPSSISWKSFSKPSFGGLDDLRLVSSHSSGKEVPFSPQKMSRLVGVSKLI